MAGFDFSKDIFITLFISVSLALLYYVYKLKFASLLLLKFQESVTLHSKWHLCGIITDSSSGLFAHKSITDIYC